MSCRIQAELCRAGSRALDHAAFGGQKASYWLGSGVRGFGAEGRWTRQELPLFACKFGAGSGVLPQELVMFCPAGTGSASWPGGAGRGRQLAGG